MTNDLNKAGMTSPLDEKGHIASTQALLDAFPMADKIAAMYAEVAIRAYLSAAPTLAASQPIGDGLEVKLRYRVENPSAWPEGFDQEASDLFAEAQSALAAMRVERDTWVKAIADIAASVALSDTIKATGSVKDMIAYFADLRRRAETAEAQVKRLTEDNEALDFVVFDCAEALSNGAFVSVDASLDFKKMLPTEIRSVILNYKARIKALEEALRRIAEGNLGDDPWQANYAKIRTVATQALSGSEKE